MVHAIAPSHPTFAPGPARPGHARPAAERPASLALDALQLSQATMHYRGISSKFQVNWTSEDLTAGLAQDMAATEPTFSLRRQLDAPCEEGDFRCLGDTRVKAQLRAQVGQTLGYEEATVGFIPGTPHPWSVTTLKTVDMNDGRTVPVTEVFTKKALYEALMRDPLVKGELDRSLSRGLFGPRKPADLDALMAFLDGRQSADGRYRFEKSMLESFTFESKQGKEVQIRMAVPYGVEVFRGTLTELRLSLPVKSLTGLVTETDLDRAGDRTAGILGEQARKMQGRFTTLERARQ